MEVSLNDEDACSGAGDWMPLDTIKGDFEEPLERSGEPGGPSGDDSMLADLAGKAHGLYGTSKATAADLADGLENLVDHGLGDHSGRALKDAIQNNPLTALIVSAAAGYILAIMTAR